jgi:uncharacterized membrane protein
MHSQPATFWQWITAQDSGDLAGFAILLALTMVLIIVALSMFVYHMHKNRLQHELKRELIDRGFSAQEIALILYGKHGIDSEKPELTEARPKLQVTQ